MVCALSVRLSWGLNSGGAPEVENISCCEVAPAKGRASDSTLSHEERMS